MPLLPADARRALVVFSAGGREFRVGDVLSILPTDAAPATQEPRTSDVETALAAFRYQRDLISAEECEAWLAQRGLAYGDLADSLARRVAGGATVDVDSAEIDALLSEAFDTQARELAAHAAVRCELGLGCLAPLPQAWPSWLTAASAYLEANASSGARERMLSQHAAALTRFAFTLVEFDSPAAAREARMCAEHDGVSLAQLAAVHGFPIHPYDALAETLAPAMASALQHALPGQICLTALTGECTGLMQLQARRAPSLDEAQVAARIDALLRARTLDALVSRHVRWTWPLHPTG